MSKKLRIVVIFFALAFVLTFLANQLPGLSFGAFNLKLILCGFGPLVSGLLCYWLLKTKNVNEISLFGTRPVFSILVCVVPLATFCLTQTKYELAVISVYALALFAYCFGEEFGWRHYLQNATGLMSEWPQSFLIGLLWFLWHYSFIEDLSSQMLGSELSVVLRAPLMIVLLSLCSYLFGMMVKRTKSILFPTAGHLLFKTGPVTMLVTACVMCVILVFWDKLPFGERKNVT
jgi:membrane protease YdiL (CAAX protease family)